VKNGWIVTDGAVGNQKQCEALAHYLGLSTEVFQIGLKQPWETLAPLITSAGQYAIKGELADRLGGPWPDVLITAGRRSALASIVLRRLSQGQIKTVHVLNPKISPEKFDCVVCPRHDQLNGRNVIQMLGAPHIIDQELLSEARTDWAKRLKPLGEPRVAVLIGASNRAYQIGPDYLQQMLITAKRLAGDLGSLMVTTSRRTPQELVSYLKQQLSDDQVKLWTGPEDGENPYFGFLAWADQIVVSADSVNMISEASGTGKAVYCSPPDSGNAKFRRFYQSMLQAGMIRPLEAEPAQSGVKPLCETQTACDQIRQYLGWP